MIGWMGLAASAFAGDGGALLSGFGLGLAGAAAPVVLSFAIEGNDDLYVLGPLASAGMVGGSALGVHLVRRGHPGWELGGAATGLVVGAGVLGVASVGALALTVPYLESEGGVPTATRVVVVSGLGLAVVGAAALPAAGAIAGDDFGGSRGGLSLGPALLPGEHGPTVGAGLGFRF